MNNKTITIDFLRHGEIVEFQNAYIGSTDIGISEEGKLQMKKLIDGKKYSLIVSSNLSRCLDFARELASSSEVELQVESQLSEIDFGDFEKYTAEQLIQRYPEQVNIWWQDMLNNAPPKGENLLDFKGRIMKIINQIIRQAKSGDCILFIGHGGSIRVVISELLGIRTEKLFSLQIDRGSLSQLSINQNIEQDITFSTLKFLNKI